MYDCRVETKDCMDAPVIIVCPHSPEEEYTDFIARFISEKLDTYCIINNGWERADKVDYLKDKANCNDLNQLLSDDVLKDEFIIPLVNFTKSIRNQHFINVYIFILHGFSAPQMDIKDKPDIVLGTGGDRPSCDIWRRDALASYIKGTGLDVREGASGGRFAGRSLNNLNQFFKRKTDFWQRDNYVHSFQIEIEHAWRKNKDTARVIAEALGNSIEKIVDLGDEKFSGIVNLKKWA